MVVVRLDKLVEEVDGIVVPLSVDVVNYIVVFLLLIGRQGLVLVQELLEQGLRVLVKLFSKEMLDSLAVDFVSLFRAFGLWDLLSRLALVSFAATLALLASGSSAFGNLVIGLSETHRHLGVFATTLAVGFN